MIIHCRRCGQPLGEPAGTGRPAAYCSVGCRRATEYEIRRTATAAEHAEAEHTRWRQAAAGLGPLAAAPPGHADREAAWWAAEVSRLDGKLRDLLDDRPTDRPLNSFQHSPPRTCNGPRRSPDLLWTTPQ
ncbi:hypothetical protein [Saccharopolyspora hattusasensis]|uniref:hypothetical protein n=1 Tax=Saccharopolyspora hattusasensis TaxID=1128679 RepID=UPI003D9586BB